MRAIEERIGAHAGLQLPEWVLVARVRDRMAALGLTDADDYLSRLEGRGGGRELDALAEALRVGETRFFRHRAHVGALRRVVAPELAARRAGERKVRGWSAGCASGEEAYTLAILLAEAMPPESGWDLEVLATDISEEALETARAGVYPAAALEEVPAAVRERWFRAGPRRGTVRVADLLAERVRFERRNLLDPVLPRRLDVILCRNVLIYFDPAARARTVERLIESLAPGGYLFLGYAESLREFGALEALSTKDGVVYRRAVDRRRSIVNRPESKKLPEPAPAKRAERPAPVARRPEEVVVSLKGTHEDAAEVAAELRRAIAEAAARVVVDLDGAEFLADGVAAVLKRAAAAAHAAGLTFGVSATRPGPRRWLTRHGFAPVGRP